MKNIAATNTVPASATSTNSPIQGSKEAALAAFTDALSRNEALIEEYQADLAIPMIDGCNIVVVVGIKTVKLGADNSVQLTMDAHPQTFTAETAGKILACRFRDGGNNTVLPKLVSLRNWQKQRIAEMIEVNAQIRGFFGE
jgi:hypothetical protein